MKIKAGSRYDWVMCYDVDENWKSKTEVTAEKLMKIIEL